MPPVVDEQTEILILGSMPSEMSLAKCEYYGNASNDFWKIMANVLGCPELSTFPYKRRLDVLLANRIGLWDAYARCERNGSMEENITSEEPNEFSRLRDDAPKLRLVCFNGEKASEVSDLINTLGYQTTLLSSSSGANRRDQFRRLEQWRSALHH